jgi:hypothetical protein
VGGLYPGGRRGPWSRLVTRRAGRYTRQSAPEVAPLPQAPPGWPPTNEQPFRTEQAT